MLICHRCKKELNGSKFITKRFGVKRILCENCHFENQEKERKHYEENINSDDDPYYGYDRAPICTVL